MTAYSQYAGSGPARKTNQQSDATAWLRTECLAAAATNDSQRTIYQNVREELLDSGLSEDGAKSMASKLAKVALWVRNGGTWPVGGSLDKAYKAASSKAATAKRASTKIVCPNCAHEWTP